MLVLEVVRYLKRRADKRPLRLVNLVSRDEDHGKRTSDPKVAIIIPTRDKYELLEACIDSVESKTTYKNYELIILNNGSIESLTLDYLERLRDRGVKVLDYPHAFNYSKLSNFGAENTDAEYLCFLNNDTEVLEPGWLTSMMDHAVLPSVGVVGSKLLFSDGTIQHLGVALGYKGAAGHVFSGLKETDKSATQTCFECSGVTFACAVVSKAKFKLANGLDVRYRVGLNDIDFCIRIAELGYANILCSCSNLLHHESKSRKSTSSLPGGIRAAKEVIRFIGANGAALRADYFFKP